MTIKPPSKPVAHYRAKVASLSRDRLPDDPVFIEAKRNLRAEILAERVGKALAEGPPLTDEQRRRIANLLIPGGAA